MIYDSDGMFIFFQVNLKCTVESHHVTPVTCIQWTPNGTKLFTGDSEGNVAITVINMDEVRMKGCRGFFSHSR